MQGTAHRGFIVSTQVLAMALALLLASACSDDPEQKLRHAGEQLATAKKDSQQAEQQLKTEQQHLAETRKQVGEDRQTASDAQKRVADAQAEVRLYATDKVVFREVQRRLLDDSKLLDTAVSVQVSQGVVTLTGNVADAETRTYAGKLAESSPGVVSVVNDIQVTGAKPAAKPKPPETSAPNAP